MGRIETREYKFGWLFMLAAVLILMFCLNVAWYYALAVVLLANIEFSFTTTTRYRR